MLVQDENHVRGAGVVDTHQGELCTSYSPGGAGGVDTHHVKLVLLILTRGS